MLSGGEQRWKGSFRFVRLSDGVECLCKVVVFGGRAAYIGPDIFIDGVRRVTVEPFLEDLLFGSCATGSDYREKVFLDCVRSSNVRLGIDAVPRG